MPSAKAPRPISTKLLLAVVSFFAGAATTLAAETLPRAVLVLDQSTKNAPWSVAMQTSLQAALNSQPGEPIAIYLENLDFGIFNGPQYENNLRNFLATKYQSVKFGAIVALGAKTLDFVVQSRPQLWPNIPVVFAAVEASDVAITKGQPDITGTIMRLPLGDLIAAARIVQPDFKQLVLVGDPFERQLFRQHFTTELAELQGTPKIVDLTGKPMDELKQTLSALSQDSVIAYTNIYSDGKGLTYTPRQALGMLAAIANRPIVIDVETFFGNGAVGGFLVQPAPVGKDAGQIALRILNGETVDKIPISTGTFKKPIFDWRQLQRWNIDLQQLPAGSEIRFRPPTAWEQYSTQITLIAAALLGQTALIIILVYEHRRRRKAEQEARLQLAELARTNRRATVGALSASIAHEINQPLTAILANAGAGLSLLRKADPDVKETSAILNDIVGDGGRLKEIIRTVRSMFKQEDQQRVPLNVSEIAREVLMLIRAEILRCQISTRSKLAEDLPPVLGESTQLQQIVLNLIMNAVDALQSVPPGARVLEIRSELRDNRVILTVRDSGPGVDKQMLDRLFEPFFTTKPSGMGMGLSICRSFAEAHGGTLTAALAEPSGMEFQLSLPVAPRN